MLSRERLLFLFKKLRDKLITSGKYEKLSQEVIRSLENSSFFNDSQVITIYPCDNYVSLLSILFEPDNYLKNTFVMPAMKNGKLSLFHISSLSDLIIKNSTIEPDTNSCFRVDISDINVILVPGVAFDYEYNWLMDEEGQTLYNTLLESSKAFKVGVCVEHQVYNKLLPSSSNKVDCLLTEDGVVHFVEI